MDLLLSNKTKRILYNDYQQDATLTNIGPYATAQRLLTYQVSRLRKLYILPYLSTASAVDATKCCDPRQSLVSSAPNTVSFAKISNLQVFLGSVNLFIQPQSYDFLHYLNGSYIQQGLTNGNDFKSAFHPVIDLQQLRLCLSARSTMKIPKVEQHIAVIGEGFKQAVLVALHVEEFCINGFFSHLQDMQSINCFLS